MSTSMENAFANAKVRTQATQTPAAKPAPVRLTLEDIRKRRLARLEGKDTTRIADEATVTEFVEISSQLLAYKREVEPLTKKGSTIPVEQLNSVRAIIEPKINACQEEMAWFVENYDDIITKAARREELRASARNAIRTIGVLDPANSDGESVRELLAGAISNGVLKLAGDSYAAAVEDSVLQELEASVEEFLAAVKAAREEEQQERTDFVREFLLSDRPVVQDGKTLPSPLQTERKRPGRVSLTRFLAGEGERTFVSVFGTNQTSNEEYFIGEVLLERKADKVAATKATRVRLCEILFFFYDKKKNEMREKGVRAIPSELEMVQPNLFREALKSQLAKDAESADRYNKANFLSAVETFNDAISFADLRTGEKGRWVVNSEWTPEGRQRGSRVTYHVESDGKNFHIGEAACDLEEVDKTFFGMYTKPTPLSALTTDKRWLAQAAINREFETNWQLHKAASQRDGAVTFITKENVASALGLEGVDGVYASSARWKQDSRGSDAPRYTAIGYILERRGEKVAITYATPGTAENIIEKEQQGEAFSLTDLPLMTKAVARAIWMAATRDFGTVPEHLKPAVVAKSTS